MTDPRVYESSVRLGATIRLKELLDERAEIYSLFPQLQPPTEKGPQRSGRTMSTDARRRMSEGMKRYWAKKHRS